MRGSAPFSSFEGSLRSDFALCRPRQRSFHLETPRKADKMASGFIGKTISLISNADIRYRGVLHSIDQAAATISLEKGVPALFALLELALITRLAQFAHWAPKVERRILLKSCRATTTSMSELHLLIGRRRAHALQVHRLSSWRWSAQLLSGVEVQLISLAVKHLTVDETAPPPPPPSVPQDPAIVNVRSLLRQ